MKLSLVLTISAFYMGLIGLMFALAPQMIAMDAMPPNASMELLAFLRVPAGAFIGIAVLNWMARNGERSTALKAVVISNAVGFGVTALMNAWAFANGRSIALLFGAIHFFFMIAFVWTGGKNSATNIDASASVPAHR